MTKMKVNRVSKLVACELAAIELKAKEETRIYMRKFLDGWLPKGSHLRMRFDEEMSKKQNDN